jgi:DNA primase
MYFPEEKISEVKNAADIVDIISEYVILKNVGKNFVGLCPFHSEKTPSFSVSPDKQIFHCFGCGTGGNVFRFLMKQNSISFPEAVKTLAEKYGIDIPSPNLSEYQKKKISEKENIFLANKKAMIFFNDIFFKSPLSYDARKYLEKRGMPEEIIKKFFLGYAPDSWEKLYKFLLTKRFKFDILEKAGLIIPNKKGGFYDRFRNRIIFPIISIQNRVVGFGGRVMDASKPKYINSPETIVYNKTKTLYGLSVSKKYIREKKSVFITEGYFDFLTLFASGITNAVSTLGTALTSDHIRLLRGYTDNMTLVYDSDDAGIKAAERSINLFIKEGISVSVMTLPKGFDPDSFLIKFKKEAFFELAKKSKSIIDFLIYSQIKKHGLSIQGKLNIIKEIKNSVILIEDDMARSLYIKKIAENINVAENFILEKIKEPAKSLAINQANRENNDNIHFKGRRAKKEKKIIIMMIQFPEIIQVIEDKNILIFFESEKLKNIGKNILKNKKTALTGGISDIISLIEDEEQTKVITRLAIKKDESWNMEGCMKIINQFESEKKFENTRNELSVRIKNAEKDNNIELLSNLLKEKINFIKNQA